MSKIWMINGNNILDTEIVNISSSDVLLNKIAIDKNGELLTGTMPNQGTKTQTLNAGGNYAIPQGYHNGSGKITVNSLASQTTVQNGKTAISQNQVLTGYEGWVNGNRITGNMSNQGTKNSTLNAGGSYIIPAGYHNGSGKVTVNSLASQTSATAAIGDILSGKTAWVNGSKLTGNIASQAGGTYKSTTSNQTISCSGKKMTSNIVITGDSNLTAANIISGKTILGVTGNVNTFHIKQGSMKGVSTWSGQNINNANNNKYIYLRKNKINLSFKPKHAIICNGQWSVFTRQINSSNGYQDFEIVYSGSAKSGTYPASSNRQDSNEFFKINGNFGYFLMPAVESNNGNSAFYCFVG